MNGLLHALAGMVVVSGIVWAMVMLARRVFKERFTPAGRLVAWVILMVSLAVPVTVGRVAFSSPSGGLAPEGGRGISAGIPASVGRQRKAASAKAEDDAAKARTTANAVEMALVTSWLAGTTARAVLALKGHISERCLANDSGKGRCRVLTQVIFQQALEKAHVEGTIRLEVLRGLNRPRLSFGGDLQFPEHMQHMGSQAIELAMLHELVRHRWWRHALEALLEAAECVWWFNPLVHLAAAPMRHDMEAACQKAMAGMLSAREKAAYARLMSQQR